MGYGDPSSIRTVPMSPEAEPKACADAAEFFYRDLPTRDPPGRYLFRTRGPRHVDRGDLMIFHYEGRIVADARLIQVRRFRKSEVVDYSGYLLLDCSQIRVFEPEVTQGEFLAVWPNTRISQVWHVLDPAGFGAWDRIVKGRVVPR